MIVLLLLYNIFYIVGTVAQYEVDINRDNKRARLSWGYVGIINISMGDLCFNVAHWILAMFYLRLAKNMPRVYYSEHPKPYNTVLWTGLVFNVFGPIVELFSGMWWYTMLVHDENSKIFKIVSITVTAS